MTNSAQPVNAQIGEPKQSEVVGIHFLNRMSKLLKTAEDEIVRLKELIPKPCTCHERDSSVCCDTCHAQGFFGHCEKERELDWLTTEIEELMDRRLQIVKDISRG